jgi:hypothetical protein
LVSVYLALNQAASYQRIGEALGLATGSAHTAVKRARLARLFTEDNVAIRANLLEFIANGIRYVFYAERGSVMRGLPTGAAAPGMSDYLSSTTENSPVWPSAKGSRRGHSLIPIYPTVPEIALRNPALYAVLGAIDLVRIGRARERPVAGEVLAKLLKNGGPENDAS